MIPPELVGVVEYLERRLANGRLRRLVDPADPTHIPGYGAALLDAARRLRDQDGTRTSRAHPGPGSPRVGPDLSAEDRAARRASKPRVPLGTPHCQPCAEEEARRRAEAGRDQIGSGR